jgi:DNA-binding NarL/FixJ family response regulator
MPSYQILLADDQAFLRKGLVSVLEQDREFFVAGEAGDGLEVLDRSASSNPGDGGDF